MSEVKAIYEVCEPMKHNGKDFSIGDDVELTASEAASLQALPAPAVKAKESVVEVAPAPESKTPPESVPEQEEPVSGAQPEALPQAEEPQKAKRKKK